MPERIPGVCPICGVNRPRGARVCACGFDFAVVAPARVRQPAAMAALLRRLWWLLGADLAVSLLALTLTLHGSGASTQGRDLMVVAHVVLGALTAAALHRVLRAVGGGRWPVVVALLAMVVFPPVQWAVTVWVGLAARPSAGAAQR